MTGPQPELVMIVDPLEAMQEIGIHGDWVAALLESAREIVSDILTGSTIETAWTRELVRADHLLCVTEFLNDRNRAQFEATENTLYQRGIVPFLRTQA